MTNEFKEKFLISKFPLQNEKIDECILEDIENQKPKKIYKFMDLSTDELDKLNSIKKGKLWVSSACKLNDPFECIFNIDSDHINSKDCSLLKMQWFENWVGESIEQLKKQTYIASLTKSKKSILMWSHYANNHTGICIEYNFEEVERCQGDNFKLLPVIYKENMADYIPEPNLEWLYRAYACKAKEWAYELEWRTIVQESSFKKGFLVDFTQPRCIYLGCNMEDYKKEQIKEFFKDSKIKIKSMIKSKCKYEVLG